MNITLSADSETIARTRKYAREHGTSINQLIRGFLEGLTGRDDREGIVDEFTRNALTHGGRSPDDFRFDRERSHERRERP
jgi:hypothetical protein